MSVSVGCLLRECACLLQVADNLRLSRLYPQTLQQQRWRYCPDMRPASVAQENLPPAVQEYLPLATPTTTPPAANAPLWLQQALTNKHMKANAEAMLKAESKKRSVFTELEGVVEVGLHPQGGLMVRCFTGHCRFSYRTPCQSSRRMPAWTAETATAVTVAVTPPIAIRYVYGEEHVITTHTHGDNFAATEPSSDHCQGQVLATQQGSASGPFS